MSERKRPRKPRNLTLNPDGVEKLLAIGAARPVPEANLSRLVDDAIAEYVRFHEHEHEEEISISQAIRRGVRPKGQSVEVLKQISEMAEAKRPKRK